MNKLNIGRASVKNTLLNPDRIYIGRECYGYSQSPLANPFFIGKDGTRDEVVEKYKVWLQGQVKEGLAGKDNSAWETLKFLKNKAKNIELLKLVCWCKENEKCHGDVVISCLNWMNDSNLGE